MTPGTACETSVFPSFCWRCGSRLQPGMRFCPECGASTVPPGGDQRTSRMTSSRAIKAGLLFLILLVFLSPFFEQLDGWGDRVSANGFQLMADNFIESYVLVGVFSVLVVALLACLLPTRPERVVGPFLGMALLIPLAVVALSLSEAGLLGYGIWFAIILVLVFCAYAVYSLQQYVQTERDSRFQIPSEKKRGTGVPTFRLPAVIGGVPSVVLLIVLWVHFGEWNIGLLVFLAGQFAVMSGLIYGALWVRYTFRQRELGKSKGVEITDATRAEDLSDSGSQPLRFSSYLSDVERHNSERWSASEPSDQSGERVLEGHANPRTSNRRANRRQLPLSVQLVGGLASVLVVAVVAVVIVLQVNDDTGDLAKMEQAALQRRSGPIMLTQPDGSVIASGYGYSSTTESTVTTSPVHDNPPGLPLGQGSNENSGSQESYETTDSQAIGGPLSHASLQNGDLDMDLFCQQYPYPRNGMTEGLRDSDPPVHVVSPVVTTFEDDFINMGHGAIYEGLVLEFNDMGWVLNLVVTCDEGLASPALHALENELQEGPYLRFLANSPPEGTEFFLRGMLYGGDYTKIMRLEEFYQQVQICDITGEEYLELIGDW